MRYLLAILLALAAPSIAFSQGTEEQRRVAAAVKRPWRAMGMNPGQDAVQFRRAAGRTYILDATPTGGANAGRRLIIDRRRRR